MCPSGLLSYSTHHKRSRLNPHCRRVEKKLRLQEQQRSLDSLPDECLYEILRRLPGNRERSNSACVSKRWLMLLSGIRSSDLLLKKKSTFQTKKQPIDLNDENAENYEDDEVDIYENIGCLTRSLKGKEVTDVRVSAMAVCTSTRGGLEKLFVCGSHPTRGLTDVGLSSISRCCPLLKSLSMLDVPFVTDSGLSELANGCPLLERLDLIGCPGITTRGLIAVAEKCPNLVSLSLDRCINIGNDGIHAVGKLCPKLDSVYIKECDLIGDAGISGLMSSASSSLTKLKLQDLSISDLALACIGHYGKAITDLHLNNLKNVAEKGFWCMGSAKGLSRLQTICVTSCHGLTNVGIDALGKGCPNLKQLHIRKCCYVSDMGLTAFISKCDALQNLILEECHLISLWGVLSSLVSLNSKLQSLSVVKCMGVKDINLPINAALPVCKSLVALTIRDCPEFSSASLATLGQICSNLVHLELTGLVGVTDEGLIPIIMNNDVGLTKVNLKGCSNITDSVVSTLLKQHGDTLQVLNLGGCDKLTDQILLEISQQCTLLEELDMSQADITDYGVALLASARHLNIRFLSLSGCLNITALSLPLISNMGPSLVGLNLQHCNMMKASGMPALEEKMYWCDILY